MNKYLTIYSLHCEVSLINLIQKKNFLLFQNIIINYNNVLPELNSNNSFKEYWECKAY
jgi:hypothetical protein